MKKRRIALITAASAAALATTVTGLSAILTDVTEPYTTDLRLKYTSDFGVEIDSENTEYNAVITPGETAAFDPYLENTGSYDAYVFMQVDTPDGTLAPNDISPEWTKVTDGVYAYTKNGVLEPLPAKAKNRSGDYSYSATSPLCTNVRLDESTTLEQGKVTIEATGYAVDAEEADSNNPSEVWQLLETSSES